MPDGLAVGRVVTAQRTLLSYEISAFGALIGDEAKQHLPGGERQMAHGLMSIALASMVGSPLNFLARRMCWEFVRPVWAGDTITANVTVLELSSRRTTARIRFGVTVVNQDGQVVCTGDVTGMIPVVD